MPIRLATRWKRAGALVILSTVIGSAPLVGDIIEYSATSFAPAARLGATTLGSCPAQNPVCVEVTIRFLADTANIVPFNVPGASGFEILIGDGRVDLFNDQTGDSLSANFAPNQIFVSVDQTNSGIGFGSVVGPTYPLGVYAGTPSIPYASYDLNGAFSLGNAFAWFCPAGTCTLGQAGPDLATDHGGLSITPTGPVGGSSFFASVIEVSPTTPEPATTTLVAAAIASLVLRRKLQRK